MFSKSRALPRHSFEEKSEERETVYVSVVEAAGGRLAEFSANDPRRLANLFSRGLEFTQTARVVTPTAATERESEQEVPWHAARHVTGPRLGPRPAICFFFLPFSVVTPSASAAAGSGSSPCSAGHTWPLREYLQSYGHDASLLVLSGERGTDSVLIGGLKRKNILLYVQYGMVSYFSACYIQSSVWACAGRQIQQRKKQTIVCMIASLCTVSLVTSHDVT